MHDSFVTIDAGCEAMYKEKGSKFLAFAFPVDGEEEVKIHLTELKKVFFDAHHHCYAFVLGHQGEYFRASDDGEPHHSAGDPILGQIRSRGFTQVLVVVVRYFGGTKLGVSGLVQAYKTSAALVLELCTSREVFIKKELILQFEYPMVNQVMKLIKDYELDIIRQDFQLSCTMRIAIRLSLLDVILHRLEVMPGLSYHVEET
ncbi:MAG: YigZ family protein [Cyclobacteriaceae bacterium]|nr:YigZ family protein [Cyclobacteriaceae bacterium]